MTKKNGCAEPFVMLPRSLLASPAWRSLSIHARRLIDFLMLEHMRHGGRKNGFLIAPQRQLRTFGIHPCLISAAIAEAEHVGLIDCIRGTGRAPNRYTLTWLPLTDGSQATNRWRDCDQQAAEIIALKHHAKARVVPRKMWTQ